MKTLRLETTAPFQGLAELVAYDEEIFAAEGLNIEWVEREHTPRQTDVNVNTPDGLSAFGSHGSTFEKGGADMYNACECGNYRRVQDTDVQGRQIGRRSIVVCAAIMVGPGSEVETPQQLAGKMVALPYYFGTHYLAIQMLEGFVPRDMIKTCRAPNNSAGRLEAIVKGEVEATTLTEPFITLAEKLGCRVIVEGFYHGTEVASDNVDAETYAAFNRAVCEAVRRINADKQKYLHYFLDYHKGQHPGLETLSPEDLRPGRIRMVEPTPVPEDELRRTYEWMRGWDMLDDVGAETLVDLVRQNQAHVAAE